MRNLNWDLGPHLSARVLDDGVAELVFGPAGAMPFTDVRGHAALAGVGHRFESEPDVRAILVRSEGKGFCAGGTPDVVQSMLDDPRGSTS
jgi:enoyl-CoA hydratase